MRHAAETVDEYLDAIDSSPVRSSLERIRAIIREEVPGVEECISYGIPMYKFRGMIAGFAAFKNHCSFFPGHTVQQFAAELHEFKTSKGTVQFKPDKPIPEPLLRAMVRARLAENIGG